MESWASIRALALGIAIEDQRGSYTWRWKVGGTKLRSIGRTLGSATPPGSQPTYHLALWLTSGSLCLLVSMPVLTPWINFTYKNNT